MDYIIMLGNVWFFTSFLVNNFLCPLSTCPVGFRVWCLKGLSLGWDLRFTSELYVVQGRRFKFRVQVNRRLIWPRSTLLSSLLKNSYQWLKRERNLRLIWWLSLVCLQPIFLKGGQSIFLQDPPLRTYSVFKGLFG